MTQAAVIQMTSGPRVAPNLDEARRLLVLAAEQGARLAVLPEYFGQFGISEQERIASAEMPGAGPQQDFLAEISNSLGLWVVGGSLPLRTSSSRVRGACLVFDDGGRQVARFDKMHLFDVHIPERDEHYQESSWTEPGEDIVVIDSPIGKLGLAVCYDLRFPELFRKMQAQGVEVFALPSAFTAATGRAHWEVLLRARAVENLSYMLAAGQGGVHANGRETWGDSMIVDPWGRILDRLPKGNGVVLADIDLERLASTRRTFPVLAHRRLKDR